MSKRFTDTNKYKKPFIRGLQGAYKLLWDYLYHDCDHAGIWIVDFPIAQIYIGEDMPVNKQDALEYFNNGEIRIVEINGGSKWFIPSFIDFQYGKLSSNNRAHNAVIIILSKYNLLKNDMVLISPLQGGKDKDKELDMELEKDKEKFVAEVLQFKTPSNADHIRNFVSYWTELNKDRTKMKFQLERTWETRKRLQKWIQNSK